MRRFIILCMQIKLLVEVFGKHYVVKKSLGIGTLVVMIAVARLLTEGRLASGRPILKKERRLPLGRRHSHWSEPQASHLTLVERKSGYAVLNNVTNKNQTY